MWVGSYLDEANVGGLLSEALTADVQAVLADETSLVLADTAMKADMLAIDLAPMISPRVHDHSTDPPDAFSCLQFHPFPLP